MPRVINVDKNPAYPAAVEALKEEGALPRRRRMLESNLILDYGGPGGKSCEGFRSILISTGDTQG